MATQQATGAKIGFEEKLWLGADKLCDMLLPRLFSGELRIEKINAQQSFCYLDERLLKK